MKIERMGDHRVGLVPAWTGAEVRVAVAALLDVFADRLPADLNARVLIKPNLNNDLPALTGNSADLRVLGALIDALLARGYRDITVADGSNVGVERRNFSSLSRLRVDRLAARAGVKILDLNRDQGREVALRAGARPKIAASVLDADLYISVPKIKTHAEAQLSCALKCQVGVCVAQDKRQMHYDLAANILALGLAVRPHLILVDGLIGMEGNGPGDGEPFRLGQLLMCDDPFLCDLSVARLVGLPWRDVPYLRIACEEAVFNQEFADDVSGRFEVLRPILPPPPRNRLARLADARGLMWLKRAARPVTDRPEVARLAHRLGVIQDVYAAQDDAVALVRDASRCGTCRRCEDFCPTGLPLAEIGVNHDPDACVGCLYCWWVCPNEAISLEGPLGQLERQARRYKKIIERL